jgi:hypothetical protein
MADGILSIRTCDEGDYSKIVDYYLTASSAFLQGMGVDGAKLPERAN